MPRRSLLTLLLLAAVVTAAVLGPRTPAGRNWVLNRVQAVAADAGWTFAWRESAGNPWRSLELRGFTVDGPGIDAQVAYARVRWFAPALLTGELPLWIEVREGDLAIDPDGFEGGSTGGAGPPVRPQLRDVDLSGVRIRIAVGSAVLIPDVAIEDVDVRGGPDELRIQGRISTQDGGVEVDASVDVATSVVVANVRDLDLTVARHWWRDIDGGTARGRVDFSPEGGWSARLDVRDGRFDVAGRTVESIEGPVTLTDGLIETELSGSTLGGSVAATGEVDLANRRWRASARATPDLASTTRWAAGSSVPDDFIPNGQGLVTATAAGWVQLRAEASISATGLLDGRPFELTSESATYDSTGGLSLEADGVGLGGSLGLAIDGFAREPANPRTLTPIAIDATVDAASYGPFRRAAGSFASAIGGAEPFRATTRLQAELASGPGVDAPAIGQLELDGALQDGSWEFFATGTPTGGGRVEGAVTLADGRLAGAVRADGIGPIAGTDVALVVRADGPLDALPLDIALTGPEPWRPIGWSFAPDVDLRGNATTVLRDGRLADLDARFGPIEVSGDLALSAAASRENDPAITARLAPVRVQTAGVAAEVRLEDARISTWTETGIVLDGSFRGEAIELPVGRVTDLAATLRLELPWLAVVSDTSTSATVRRTRLRLDGPTLDIDIDGSDLTARISDQAVDLDGTAARADVDLRLDLGDPIGTLRGTARVTSDAARIEASRSDRQILIDGILPRGLVVGAVALPTDVRLNGRLADDGDGELLVDAGDVAYRATVRASGLDLGAAIVDGELATNDQRARLTIDVTERRLTLDGAIDLQPLGAWSGATVEGIAEASAMEVSLGGPNRDPIASGVLATRIEAPVSAEAIWTAGRLTGAVATPVGSVTLGGALSPGAPWSIDARHAWGRASWTADGLAGNGTVPGSSWRNVAVPDVPWMLRAPSGPAGPIEVRAGDTVVSFDGGRLNATLDQPVAFGDVATRLVGSASWNVGAEPARYQLGLVAPDEERWLTARGAGPRVDVEAVLPSRRVAEAAAVPIDLAGRLQLEGRLDLTTLEGSVGGVWTTDTHQLDVELVSATNGVEARIVGSGLDLTLDGAGFRATADDVPIEAFVGNVGAIHLDGALAMRAPDGLASWRAAAWQGRLAVERSETPTLELLGSGGPLRAAATIGTDAYDVVANGTLLPDLAVTVEGRHRSTGATGRLFVSGPGGSVDPSTLTLSGQAELPAFAGTVAGSSYGYQGLDLGISGSLAAPAIDAGDSGRWTLDASGWAGRIATTADIDGVSHTASLAIAGPSLAPSIDVQVTGATTNLDAGFDVATGRGRASVVLEAGAWPESFDPIGLAGARLDAELNDDGAWLATLGVDVQPSDQPLSLSATIEGRGLDAEASWHATAGETETLARGELALDRDALRVTSDLAGWDLPALARWTAGPDAVPDLTGAVTGSVRYQRAWEGDSDLDVAASLVGRVGPRTVKGTATVSDDDVEIRIDVDDNALNLRRAADDGSWRVEAAGDAYALTGDFDARLRDGRLVGSLAERPLELRLARNDDGVLAVGRWDDASVSLGVLRSDGGWRADLAGSLPPSSERDWSGDATADLVLRDGTVALDALRATVDGGVSGTLSASGDVWPRLALDGSWSGSPFEPGTELDLRATGRWPVWTVGVDLDELALDAEGEGVRVVGVALNGTAELFDRIEITTGESRLSWTEADAWSGAATARLEMASLDLVGVDGRLDIDGVASFDVDGLTADPPPNRPFGLSTVLDASATGAPWASTLAGELMIQSGLAARAGGASTATSTADAPPLRFTSDATLSGTLLSPQLTGLASLHGVASATGTLDASTSGARLELAGPSLHLEGRITPGAWSIDATAVNLVLDPWLPELSAPRLDVELSGGADWDDAATITARDLQLRADGASLTGNADVAGGVRAVLELDADLERALTGPARGHLVGPVAIRGDDLRDLDELRIDASVRADQVSVGGVDVDGTVSLEGPVLQPNVRANLQLGGPVEGTIDASWFPERRIIDLVADLEGHDAWQADLGVGVAGDLVEASGTISAGGGTFDIGTVDDHIVLTGRERWNGAQIDVRPFAGARGSIDVDLPLSTLSPSIDGRLRANVSSEAGWLDGQVVGVRAYGVTLPDLELTGAGAVLTLAGDGDAHLDASIDLAGGGWTVSAGGLAVDGVGTVAVDAEGRGASGRAEGRIVDASGSVVGFDGEIDSDLVTLRASGVHRGGQVSISANRTRHTSDAFVWSGALRLDDVETPAGAASLDATMAGSGPVPDATASVSIDGPFAIDGRLAVEGAGEARIDLSASGLDGRHLDLSGDVWPQIDLRIAADEGAATLRAPSWQGDTAWRIEGATLVSLPGADLLLAGEGDGVPTLRVRSPWIADGSLRAELPTEAPVRAIETLTRDGLTFAAEGSLGGTLILRTDATLEAESLTWRSPIGDLSLNGTVGGDAPVLDGRLVARDGTSTAARTWHAISDGTPQGFRVVGDFDGIAVEATSGPLDGNARWTAATGEVHLRVVAERFDLDATLARGQGIDAAGEFREIAISLPNERTATLSGSITAGGDAARFGARLAGSGSAHIDGQLSLFDLLPVSYRPPARTATTNQASLRLETFDITALPELAGVLPHLEGTISGIGELRGTRLIAQIASLDLRTAGRSIPLRIDAGGDLTSDRAVSISGSLAGSRVQGSADLDGLDLLVHLDRFPGQAPIEARFGPLDADVEATGVLRLGLPWREPLDGDVRLATEFVRLERAGVVTTGVLTLNASRGRIDLDAAFEGDGRWTADASISADEIDVRIDAFDANATPLLGLVPSLARLDTTARGSLSVRATGTPISPQFEAESSQIEFGLAGTTYRLDGTTLTLDGPALAGRTVLTGVNPVGGRLVVAADATLDLAAGTIAQAAVILTGDAEVPLIGSIDELDGLIDLDPNGRPRLNLTGRLGAPVSVSGTLAPLDLRVEGSDLTVRIPTLLLDRATADLDLALRYEDAVRLSGRIAARDGRFALGIRPSAQGGRSATTGSSGGGLVFDDVTVVGRRLTFSESFGSAEFDADLQLSGTSSTPRLSGAATARRGTLRFSGRDFALDTAIARFEPSRGAFPSLDVDAVARFDKQSVLQNAPQGVSFVRPPGSTFNVRLAFEAEVVPTPGSARPFDLQVDPILDSNAQIAVPAGQGLAPGTRSMTEAELLQLVALGRLDLSPDLGAGDVAGGVARSALDNAVDLLLLSELQSAVAQALGVDLVEIRTSALSDVIAGGEDPFGVSLRLGGYLDEGLFASFEIGRYADADATEALSNTLALTYELGPIALDLATRVGFGDVTELAPTTELSGTVRYQLTPFIAVEGGATISTPETEARFGVTLRW